MRSNKNKIEKQKRKIRRTQNTPVNSRQPADFKTTCRKTRPTPSPTLARFHRSRDCGNRPCTALAISTKDECYTHTNTQTKKQIKLWHPVRTPVRRGFFAYGEKQPRSLRSLGLTSLRVDKYLRPEVVSGLQQAMCVQTKTKSKYRNEKSGAPKTHHGIQGRPPIGTTSRRRAAKHVPHRRPHSPDSIDPGIGGNGLVQLSQSVKMTNVTHARTQRPRDKLNYGTLYAPR